jgi:hypothetical protein
MNRIDLVEALIDGAEEVHARLESDWLSRLKFLSLYDRQDDRVVVEPGGKVHAVRHRLRVWEAPARGRVVWFWLESEIPHMSSIVACMATPVEDVRCPLFVMNFNLKLKASTFNTIIGYRGEADRLEGFRGAIPGVRLRDAPAPALAKPNPENFDGVRWMFMLERKPILWALDLLLPALDRWFAAVGEQDAAASQPLFKDHAYAAEMCSLHGREGGVYDAVFGAGWLSDLFRREVLR